MAKTQRSRNWSSFWKEETRAKEYQKYVADLSVLWHDRGEFNNNVGVLRKEHEETSLELFVSRLRQPSFYGFMRHK